MNHWWRAYDEAVDDPKLQFIEPPLFKAWFNLLCVASAHGGALPTMEHIAFKLRMPVLQAELTVSALIAVGLFDKTADGVIAPHNWTGRQFQSDGDRTHAERQRRYRHRKRHGDVTRDRHGDVTETRTDTEQSRVETEQNREREGKPARVVTLARGTRLPDNWQPSIADMQFAGTLGFRLFEIDNEVAKFVDYWHARAGPGGVKRDWSATWRNWCRREIEHKGKGNGARPSIVDAADRLIADEKIRTGEGPGPLLDLTPSSSGTSETPPRPLPKR